ncbi:hypothetical protein [Streptomyces sp. NPDC060027]|uniref:hypothetical protein n=1 Tax=Streptomyces sp. NPDC060027 TaxID=3347040 RepID=UPI0036A6FFA2
MWAGSGEQGAYFDKVVERILIPAVASPVVAGVAALPATVFALGVLGHARVEAARHGDTGSDTLGFP